MAPPRRRLSESRSLLLTCFDAALQAVDGRGSVHRQLDRESLEGPWHVVAIGKAAGAMTAGAIDSLGARVVEALVVTAPGRTSSIDVLQRTGIRVIESAHPQPDERSLLAGQAVVEYIESRPRRARLRR